jgi:small GTP-binding protein
MVIGDPVGKTCLVIRYVNNTFNDSYRSTVGADFFAKDIDLNGKIVKLQIWDTAG